MSITEKNLLEENYCLNDLSKYDFTKAFDTLDHKMLFSKLVFYGLSQESVLRELSLNSLSSYAFSTAS